jgi:hypothetical protein
MIIRGLRGIDFICFMELHRTNAVAILPVAENIPPE